MQGVVARAAFVGQGEVTALPWPHLLEVAAHGVAMGAAVARDAAMREVNARTVAEQGLARGFPGSLDHTGGTRAHRGRAGGARVHFTPAGGARTRPLVVREMFLSAMDWWDVFPAAVTTSETITSADQGTQGVHTRHQGLCTPLPPRFRRAAICVASAAR